MGYQQRIYSLVVDLRKVSAIINKVLIAYCGIKLHSFDHIFLLKAGFITRGVK